ncbi:vacuolar sorting protein 9 domain-containing protein [Tieghemostelium lacteum]|uniref:Vacuolar sorting protein 9 domain-containing protein n=1 Tax=Tieghemostelium lacteum TaxID=361077 RepID=A0A151Z8U9_TIELA|nr:vacuolar sorting protein 9 domain-containing protein [Tieghemostelium lacteum]|eukprot:KYQ90380.1 vacuolar sorting protein 9 domain-containing protein [Tieghemostelium lacteum]
MWFNQSATFSTNNNNSIPINTNNSNINKSNEDNQEIRHSTSYDSFNTIVENSNSNLNQGQTTPTIQIKIGGGNNSNVNTIEESAKEKASFYQKLKNPKANDIRKSLTNFANQFASNGPSKFEDQGVVITNYTRELENWILSNPLWLNASESEIEGIRDGIEKYIMTKVFHCTFMPARLGRLELSDGNKVVESQLVPTEEDLKLYKLILIMSFIEPVHLDIQQSIQSNEQRLQLAITELNKINTYKTPRDKLVCIYNCCKVIFMLLKSLNNNNPSGADDFLPILIYVVLKANPPMLHSNVQFIGTFRNPNQLSTETGCYFTHLVSAITFIENLTDSSQLTIEESEFERLKEKSEMELPLKLNSDMIKRLNLKVTTPPNQHKPTLATTIGSGNQQIRGHTRHLSITNSSTPLSSSINSQPFFGDLEDLEYSNTGGDSPLSNYSDIGLLHMTQSDVELEKKYEFINYQADDLKLGQINRLLEDYKRLVFENRLLKSKFKQNSTSNSNNNSQPNSHNSSMVNILNAIHSPTNNSSPVITPSPSKRDSLKTSINSNQDLSLLD